MREAPAAFFNRHNPVIFISSFRQF